MAKQKLAVGLDLGEYSLKCAVVDPNSGALHGLWQAEVFSERQSQEQRIEREILRDRLRDLLGQCENKFPGFNRQVMTSVPGEFFRYLELPVMSAKELEVGVPFEAQKHIPFPLEEVTLNYLSVPQLIQDKKKSAVFFVAAHKEGVKALTTLLEDCGLNVERVEVPTLALSREFTRNHLKSSNEFLALVHLGFGSSRVIVIQNGYPYYTRKISLAGRDFTYGFQMSHQWSWQEAEKHKLSYDVSRREVALEPFLDRLSEEIKKSLDFFAKEFQTKEGKVSKVFLSGGTALMGGLGPYLSERLGLAVAVDSWNELQPNREQKKLEAAPYKIAMGLAFGN